MSLVDKLRRIAAPAEGPAPRPGGGALPGALVEGPGGGFWLRRVEIPLDHRHGRLTLGEVRTAPTEPLASVSRDDGLRRIDLRRAVFFDTETTSLGGGVGTYVFLLGAGFFREDRFVVEQYFLRDMTEERPLLQAMNERFRAFDLCVSFHGKGFDAPRLQDRLTFHGLSLALPAAHLDLCVLGRSLYRGAFQDCRLQTFERELVGFLRTDDLPGADCPHAFFSHLRGDSSLIPRVFEHNLYDVLTLPAVAASFAREVQEPSHPIVLANLGGVFESLGRDRRARDCYRAALDGLRRTRHPLFPRTLERLALLERRAGRHGESARLLLERKDIHPFSLQPLEDLAKYYEHRARDLGRAEEAAADARSRVLTGKIRLPPGLREKRLRSLEHRLGRIRRRREHASCGEGAGPRLPAAANDAPPPGPDPSAAGVSGVAHPDSRA